jgi:uncharacterized protein YjlB
MAQVKTFQLADDGTIPNHPRFPLLLYSGAFAKDAASEDVREEFERHGWTNCWVNGVYDYHHFHSDSHEVLGCFAGWAEVLFGGDWGVKLTFQAGDCVVIPAGVGHKRLHASADFGVVGAYPDGRSPDLCRGGEDPAEVRRRVADTPKPGTDPVAGAAGPLLQLWPG